MRKRLRRSIRNPANPHRSCRRLLMMSTKLSGNTSSAMRRRGMTMFEFAMFLSVLFAVFLSVFEFCRVAVIRHTVDNAVYEACLVGMRPGVEARDCEQAARAVSQ